MGRPSRRIRFSEKANLAIEKTLHRDTRNELVEDVNSLWGHLSLQIFGRNTLQLRSKVKRKWCYEKEKNDVQFTHYFSSKNVSKHGRMYATPFWARRKSYEIGFKQYKKGKCHGDKNISAELKNSEEENSDFIKSVGKKNIGIVKYKQRRRKHKLHHDKKNEKLTKLSRKVEAVRQQKHIKNRKYIHHDADIKESVHSIHTTSEFTADSDKHKRQQTRTKTEGLKKDARLTEEKQKSEDNILCSSSESHSDTEQIDDDVKDIEKNSSLKDYEQETQSKRKRKYDSKNISDTKTHKSKPVKLKTHYSVDSDDGTNQFYHDKRKKMANFSKEESFNWSESENEIYKSDEIEQNVGKNYEQPCNVEYSDYEMEGNDDDDDDDDDDDFRRKGLFDNLFQKEVKPDLPGSERGTKNENYDVEEEKIKGLFHTAERKNMEKTEKILTDSDDIQEQTSDEFHDEECHNIGEKKLSGRKTVIVEDLGSDKSDIEEHMRSSFSFYKTDSKCKLSDSDTSVGSVEETRDTRYESFQAEGKENSDQYFEKAESEHKENIHNNIGLKSQKETDEQPEHVKYEGIKRGEKYKDKTRIHKESQMTDEYGEGENVHTADASKIVKEAKEIDEMTSETEESETGTYKRKLDSDDYCSSSTLKEDNQLDKNTYADDGDSDKLTEQNYQSLQTFNIELTYKEWKSIKPISSEAKKLRPSWTETLSDKFNKIVPTCVLAFKYHNINKKHNSKGTYFNAKAACKHEGCGIFMFSIPFKPKKKLMKNVKVKVNVIRPIVNHRVGDIKKRKLQGKKRQKAKANLQTKKPSTFYYEILGEMPAEEVESGNYTKCQTKDVLRKAKSEWNVSNILHSDIFTELTITQDILQEEDDTSSKVKGYIQEISYKPLMVTLYTEQSLEVAKNAIKFGDGVFYIDATGKVVSKIPTSRNIFYYAMVVKGFHKGKPPVPVLEFLSDQHGTYYIVRPLLAFFGALQKWSTRFCKPKRIECDFSWAFIHSLLIACNKTSIQDYLQKTYMISLGKKEAENMTVIHICAAHMLKAVRTYLRDKMRDINMRNLLLRIFALLQNCSSVQETVYIWKIMCTVFGNNFTNTLVKEAVKKMRKMVLAATLDGLEQELICESIFADENEQEGFSFGGIRQTSPFTTLFNRYYNESLKEVSDETEELNEYFSLEVLTLFKDSYKPLISLWGGIMLGDLYRHLGKKLTDSSDSLTRDTNSTVENWMKIVKVDTLGGKKRLRIGLFARNSHVVLKGRFREYLNDVKGKSGIKRSPPRKKTPKRKHKTSFDAAEDTEKSGKKRQCWNKEKRIFLYTTQEISFTKANKKRRMWKENK